jgi:poly(beta-D-mannuronate) C5 epimerase
MPELRTERPAAALPGRIRLRPVRAVLSAGLLFLTSILAAPAGALPPDQISTDLQTRLSALATAEADVATRGQSAAVLIAAADLKGFAEQASANPDYGPKLGPILTPTLPQGTVLAIPPAERPSAEAVVGDRLNLRLALTLLSQSHGDEDNGAVLEAQTDPGQNTLVLRAGVADVATLAGLLRDTRLAGDLQGRSLTLRVPLVIWPGARLILRDGDEILLSRSDGAFVLNLGTLEIDGGAIRGIGEAHEIIRRFYPFVTTADSGVLLSRRATFQSLGFGATLKFSGVSVVRNLLRPADRPSVIDGSLFEDVLSVAIQGDAGARLSDNRFRDARSAALIVSGAKGVRVTGNIFTGKMSTNAIRVERGSAGGTIAGNVVLGGERAGIVVRDQSHDALVTGNVVWHRTGGGITVQASECALVEGNLVIANSQKGIELRNAPGGRIEANSLLSNDSVALWVSNQRAGQTTHLTDNIIAFNNAGLASAQGGTLIFQGNDLSRQYLQFVSGDLTAIDTRLAIELRGEEQVVLETGATSGASTDITAVECSR